MEPLKDGVAPNAAIKAWCEFLGLRGGQVRPPLTPLDASQKAKLSHDLIDAGLQPA
jgi:4-hydroxy-tetrahydrodipicolinate synthase